MGTTCKQMITPQYKKGEPIPEQRRCKKTDGLKDGFCSIHHPESIKTAKAWQDKKMNSAYQDGYKNGLDACERKSVKDVFTVDNAILFLIKEGYQVGKVRT